MTVGHPGKVLFGVSIVLVLSACSDDDGSSSTFVSTPTSGRIEELPPAKITSLTDLQSGLQSYSADLEGYTALVNNLVFVGTYFVPSSLIGGAIQTVPAAPFDKFGALTGSSTGECPKVDSVENSKTINGVLEGSLSGTVDFGERGCVPKGLDGGTFFGRISLDLKSEKGTGHFNLQFSAYKYISSEARVTSSADGAIRVEWEGASGPTVSNGIVGRIPKNMVTTVDLLGVDLGREMVVKGSSTFREIRDALFELVQDYELTESGVTHYLSGSSSMELMEGVAPKISPVGVAAVSGGETVTFRLDQRLEYGSSAFGRFKLDSLSVTLSSACPANPTSGETSVYNESGTARVEYHETCDGKASATTGGQLLGEVTAVTLQPVATLSTR